MVEQNDQEMEVRGLYEIKPVLIPDQLRERYSEYNHATVGILFVNKNKEFSKEQILGNLDYYHLRSSSYLDFFMPGYDLRDGDNKFDIEEYVQFIEYFERNSKWRYSGETELLLLQFHADTGFDFSKCISIWIDKAVANGYVYSFSVLFEQLVQTARKTVEVPELSKGLMLDNLPELIFENIITHLKSDVVNTIRGESIYRLQNLER